MPSTSVTPAAFVIDWAAVSSVPARTTAGALRLVFDGGSVIAGPGTGTSQTLIIPTLPRLERLTSYFDSNGRPTQQMQLFWQTFRDGILEAFTALDTRDDSQDAILARLDAAYSLAQAASDSAASVTSRLDIENSYTDPTSVLIAKNDGTVTIAAHNRVYGDGSEVSISAGGISGFSSGDVVVVFYTDAAREGGTVTFQGVTQPVAQTGNVHVLGAVTIPASGAVEVSGSGATAPGYVPPEYAELVELYYRGY